VVLQNQIELSELAILDLSWIANYGGLFDQQATLNMQTELGSCFNRIRSAPESFALVYGRGRFRSIRLKPHYRIYYEYFPEQNRVEIVRIFDSRQHPDNLKL
jgi:plasmid stabilization system protein ParE